MHVIVQSTLPVTDGLHQVIEQQAKKLDRLGLRINKAQIFLETLGKKKNDIKNASVKYAISLPGKKRVVVKRAAADMYEAIVEATDRVVRQLRKVKEKRIDKRRN